MGVSAGIVETFLRDENDLNPAIDPRVELDFLVRAVYSYEKGGDRARPEDTSKNTLLVGRMDGSLRRLNIPWHLRCKILSQQ